MNLRRSLVAILVAGAAIWGVANGLETEDGETWERVVRQDLVIGVELEGELQAVDSADLGPPAVRSVSNFKIAFMVPEGTEVQAGQPALGFDTSDLQRQLQLKVAARDSSAKELEKRIADLRIEDRQLGLQLAEAEASLRLALLKLEGTEKVSAQRDIEKARIDRRLAELQIENLTKSREHLEARTRADVEFFGEKRDRAAARVTELEEQIRAMTVPAPRSGTVIYKTNWRGEKKKVGDNVWRAEKILQIPDLKLMRGEAKVAEADAGRIEVGQAVALRLDTYPDHEYRAKVVKIHRTVQQKSWRNPQKVVRLDVELEATDTERMRPGMRFRGEIEIDR
ncbi:MAG: HlyD family efflux transporter periplasmic adaptor subunit, partial [Acidobacteriota bacterium]